MYIDKDGNIVETDSIGAIKVTTEDEGRIEELERQVEALKYTVTQMLQAQGLSGEYLFDKMSLLPSLEK